MYTTLDVPLYRGIQKQYVKMEDYKIGSINYWPGFSSTSKKKQVAIKLARRFNKTSKTLLFEIYVTENNPKTHINLPKTWSFYPSEEEVLLLPSFCFQVVGIREDDDVTVVTLIEIPFQNLLEIKEVKMSQLIWLDNNIES